MAKGLRGNLLFFCILILLVTHVLSSQHDTIAQYTHKMQDLAFSRSWFLSCRMRLASFAERAVASTQCLSWSM